MACADRGRERASVIPCEFLRMVGHRRRRRTRTAALMQAHASCGVTTLSAACRGDAAPAIKGADARHPGIMMNRSRRGTRFDAVGPRSIPLQGPQAELLVPPPAARVKPCWTETSAGGG